MPSKQPEYSMEFQLNPANPGQFLACCGLVELSDRLWPGVISSFDKALTTFRIGHESLQCETAELLLALMNASLKNTMTIEELDRLSFLKSKKTASLSTAEKKEKSSLDSMQREKPLVLGEPFPNIRFDWYLDTRSGGSRFKTWAGQQSVYKIALAMREPVTIGRYSEIPSNQWLEHFDGNSLTFNFDSDVSVQSAPLDMGFSLDPLKMACRGRPMMNLLCFFGLQRFRPRKIDNENLYCYSFWTQPLGTTIASTVASGGISSLATAEYSFPLLYRTKYLKSFLPANPFGA